MDRHFVYKTEGVCAREISFDFVDGAIWNIKFEGGCRGNSQGVAALADGLKAEDVIRRCQGIDCHGGFSCPDQLARAIRRCMEEGGDA